ncbi:prefoldin domain-containing protein [Phytohabitans suffuscus]|uniref:Translation initiation factor n=1 Tax=Phytohabitans suffuscus TaxID=624315 RepID=A0A6F8YX18_9ACTN|nr:hypothetical protein [Phytohabitans suffuscus]BCB90642.1 hypothetical protein Psuf_079550 [Phytohabitans suffuscus]
MAPPRSAVRGLSTDDLQAIRDTLGAGRKPRVMFTEAAGQIAGQVGQVVRLTDPELSEEWVVVRFGKDELPFSPTDLVIPPKGAKAAPAAKKAAPPQEPAVPQPELKITRSPVPAPREEAKVTTVDEAPVPAADKPAPPRKAAKVAKAKAPAGLTVTLSYTEGEWTVSASQGAKALAKPYTIRPSEALKMVALVDVPGVQEAVEQILSAERSEAEQQAEKLRAELAEIEARLAELRDVG